MKSSLNFFKRKKFSNIGIFIVTFLTVLLATVFIGSYQNVIRFEDRLTSKSNIEDFSFYPNVSNLTSSEEDSISQRIDDLANTYNFTWEDHMYVIYNESNTLYRIYDSERTIDNFLIIEGQNNTNNQDVMIDYLYANEHNISVGDKITIKEQEYNISAIVVLPDMISPIVDDSGKLYDKTNQAIVIMDYDSLEEFGEVKHSYVGKFDTSVKSSIIQEMQTDTNFYSITKSSDNLNIFSSLSSQKSMNLIIVAFSISILSSIVLLLIFLSISECIREDYKNLGVLKALGYTKFEICRQYLNYFIIVWLPAFIGYVIGKTIISFFYSILYNTFSIPFLESNYFDNILVMVFIPSISLAILSFVYALVKVRKPAIDMIKDSNQSANNIVVQKINNFNKKGNFIKQARKKILLSKISIIFFVAFSGFAFTVQSLFSYSTYAISNNIEHSVMSEYGYKYNVKFINNRNDDTYSSSLKFYSQTGRLLTGNSYLGIDLLELDNDNLSLLKLENSSGDTINISELNGIVINKWISIKYDLNKGDKVTIYINGKNYNLRIAEVSQSVYGTSVYMSNKYAKQIFNEEDNGFTYNGILTNDSISFDSNEHLSIISKDEISESLSRMNRVYLVFSIMLLSCGLIIGVTILIFALHSVVSNQKKYISFMKLIGYTNKECDYLVINSYRIIVLLGYLLALPYTFFLCSIMFNMLTKSSNFAYLVSFNPIAMFSCLVFVICITELSLAYFKYKLRKVTFREILES